nr:immunoglobulin heavy chain junction region [Macaca mulatta]
CARDVGDLPLGVW